MAGDSTRVFDKDPQPSLSLTPHSINGWEDE
jgi:hypothetical protein